jgi:hypothetical protein
VNEPSDHLADAFYYSQNEIQKDLEKVILSVAFLLDWRSDSGNHDIPAMVALGFSMLLKECAEQSRFLYSLEDVRRAAWGAGIDGDKHKKLSNQLSTGEFVPFELEIRPGPNFNK